MNNPIRFNQKATEGLRYYVYCLVDPRDNKIFYIGKGKNQRVFDHVLGAVESDPKSEKIAQIKDILAEGLNVKHYVLRHNLEEKIALEMEALLIDLLNYPDFNFEQGLKTIQGGKYSSLYGIKTVEEINLMYDCPDIEFSPEDNLLFININTTYNSCKENIYEAVKGYWKLSLRRLHKNPPTVVAHYHGIVRAVYTNTEWLKNEGDSKVWFKGEVDDKSPFLNKSVKKLKLNKFQGCTYGETAYRKTFNTELK